MGRRGMVVVLTAIAVIALIAVGGLLVRGSAPARGGLNTSRVARRIEQIRGLRFVRLPRVHMVNEAQMRRIVARGLPLKELGRAASAFTGPTSAAAVPLVERLELLELLGAVPVGTAGFQVLFAGAQDPGGLFDPRTGEIYVRRRITSAVGGEEGVLAHELTHALEYQHRLHTPRSLRGIVFDQLEADRALIEGPAVLAQYIYATRYLGLRGTLNRFLAGLSNEAQRRAHLPRVLLADALFGYIDGALVAQRLQRSGGWGAVAKAELEPPAGTRSALTGSRMAERDPKVNVARILGRRWHPEPRQTFGAYDTATLLTPGSLMPSPSLIALWRGGSLRSWNDLAATNVGRCRRPCAKHYVVLARWRWADASTARTAASDLRRSLAQILIGPQRRGAGLRTRLGSSVAITVGQRVTTIAVAPNRAMANALAAANHPGTRRRR